MRDMLRGLTQHHLYPLISDPAARLLALSLAFLFLPGCLRESPAPPAETRIFTNGTLGLKDTGNSPKSLYIEAVDQNGQPMRFPERSVFRNAGNNFVVADSPSAAAFILHIDILQEGGVDATALEKLVQSGFGSQAVFSGSGSAGLLADILLVQRRVPTSKRENMSNLQNISARNALESARMRIGVLIPGDMPANPKFHDELAEALLLEVRKALQKDG